MAIQILYYNVVIPIVNLSKCEDLKNISGALDFYTKQGKVRCVWHDDHLFTIGGIMGPQDVEMEVKALEELGLNPYKEINGEQHWDDLCVVDFADGPTLPCSWVKCELNPFDISSACLNGKDEGELIKPCITTYVATPIS
jgi:hypothetical protein